MQWGGDVASHGICRDKDGQSQSCTLLSINQQVVQVFCDTSSAASSTT